VIRFGLGGLKGVGEAAVESIIEEREKNGPFTDIFDFIRRVNQRTVNKKTLENLAYAGAFDCFPEHHRAQYFTIVPGETATGLEKIIRYGQTMSNQSVSASNTLFGDMPDSIEIPTPRLPDCAPWSLTQQLDFEKEVTGMFLSGHPLDHYRFEMKHYGVTPIGDFNEFRDSIRMQSNPGRQFRLIALVASADHRVAQNGNKYGRFNLEDYTGKTEVSLFREEYLRLHPFLVQGTAVYITGYFKPRFNKEEFEFKITGVSLAETLKKTLTKQLTISTQARYITSDLIDFMETNRRSHPGDTALQFVVVEPAQELRISMVTGGNGLEMNDDLIQYLQEKPELDVQVQLT